jgi:hypothetical protein
MIQLSPKLAALISPRASPRLTAVRLPPQPPPMELDNTATSSSDSTPCSKSCSCAKCDSDSEMSDLSLDDVESASHDSASVCSSTTDGSDLYSMMDDLKLHMHTLHAASKDVAGQMTSLYQRAKDEDIQWYDEPLQFQHAASKEWAAKKKLPAAPTLREFFDACFDSAISLDLETRILHFTKEDAAALWGGQRRLTIFDIIGLLPSLFL